MTGGRVIAHRGVVGLVLAASLVLWPRIADACSVCFGGDGAEAATFILTTALLTFTPFVVVGCIGFWVVRRIRRSETDVLRVDEQHVADVTAADRA